jgi:type I restriction enzyme S subunit
LGEVVEIYDSKRIPLSEEERLDKKGIYPYCGANGIIDYIDDYIFDGEFILLAEDGGFFGKFEKSAYLMTGKFWVNNHAHVLREKSGRSVNRFILAWLIFEDISKYISGSTRQKLNQSVMRNIPIPLPPLPEQQKIAEILETIDNAIEKTDKIIEKYKRIKQGLMQDLLTKSIDENGNIRDEKTHKFKDSPLGRIPEEWEVVRLGEVCDIKGGKRLPKGEELTDEGHPYIRLTDIEDVKIQINKVKFISENTRKKISKYTVSKDDVIISIAGTIGLVALIPEILDNANLTENAAKLTNFKNINKFYLCYFLSSHLTKKQINEMIGVVAQPKLALFRLATLYIPLPPLPEQKRIAEILSQIDQTIEKEQQYKEKLQKIKQGLMQDLLTGKVRVNHLVEEKENEQRYTSNFTRT